MLTTLSAKSWHFRLARNFTSIPLDWEPDPKTPEEVAKVKAGDTWDIAKSPVYTGDLCNYVPYVLDGLFKYISMLSMFTILLMPVASYFGYLAACVATMSIIDIKLLAWVGMIFTWCPILLLIGAYIGSTAHKWVEDHKDEKRRKAYLAAQEDTTRYVEVYGELPPTPKEPKEPGFLTVCYRKFKDKTCIGLKIK